MKEQEFGDGDKDDLDSLDREIEDIERSFEIIDNANMLQHSTTSQKINEEADLTQADELA